jgi:hypothetical protein
MNRLPDFVVIGAMKCATSTLHDQLAAQPGIFMSTPKEPNFFSDDDVYARGLDWYRGLFAAAAETDLCGESSTHYTKRPRLPSALERMRPVLPHARLVYVMRHPIDRLVSHYMHEWSERRVSGTIDHEIGSNPDLVNFSRYGMQLEPYIDAYGPENILPIFFERMVRQPQETLERLCRFIGYTQTPRWQDENDRRNVGAERMRQSKIRDLIVEAPLLRTIRRRWIPQSWREWVKGFWRMKERPRISPPVADGLREVFDADLEMLGKWLGVRLTCESFKEVAAAAPREWSAGAKNRCETPGVVHS